MAVAPDSARDRMRSRRREGMVERGLRNDMMFTAPILSRAPDLDRLRFLALIPARAPHREEAASAPKAHGSADAGVPATVATDTVAAVAVGARTEAGVAIVIRPWSEISTSQLHLLRVHPQFGPFLTRSDSKSANEHWSCFRNI